MIVSHMGGMQSTFQLIIRIFLDPATARNLGNNLTKIKELRLKRALRVGTPVVQSATAYTNLIA
jgi:hypothetical protein